jgi:acyl-CoA dehydrogenase
MLDGFSDRTRVIGAAERAIELMAERALTRHALGSALADNSVVQHSIALSRIELDQARLLAAARAACRVIDRAIQLHGAAGIGKDTPLPAAYAYARSLRKVDGSDEVHLRTVVRTELGRARARRQHHDTSQEALRSIPARR